MIKKLLKILLVVGVIAGIAVGSYFILKACGFTTVSDFERLRNVLGDSVAFWGVIVLLQVFQSVFLPISNSLISFPVSMIFNNEIWKVFLASWIGITIGNIILFFIGKYGGEKIVNWVLGDKEKSERIKSFMRDGKSFYVIAGLTPIIPSDVANVIAGIANYNTLFVIITTIITRGLCVATTCWFGGLVTTYPWVIAILVVVIGIMGLIAFLNTRRIIRRRTIKNDSSK